MNLNVLGVVYMCETIGEKCTSFNSNKRIDHHKHSRIFYVFLSFHLQWLPYYGRAGMLGYLQSIYQSASNDETSSIPSYCSSNKFLLLSSFVRGNRCSLACCFRLCILVCIRGPRHEWTLAQTDQDSINSFRCSNSLLLCLCSFAWSTNIKNLSTFSLFRKIEQGNWIIFVIVFKHPHVPSRWLVSIKIESARHA